MDLDSPTEQRSSSSSQTNVDPDPPKNSEPPVDTSRRRESRSSCSSLTTLASDPAQDPQFPPSPTYRDFDHPPGHIPPLRCRRGALHQSTHGYRDWYKMWGADEYSAKFNVEDIIIAGGLTVVQKIVARDSIVAVKIAVRDPKESGNNVFKVKYDAATGLYRATFEVAGFSHFLHGAPRLRRGYTYPIVAHERLPVGRGPPAPLRPNAYDESREWVKSVGCSYNRNPDIRNFRSRNFSIMFALHEHVKIMCLHFFAQDLLEREDGSDWRAHGDQTQHIEHLLLNRVHPMFKRNGDIFLEETFDALDNCD